MNNKELTAELSRRLGYTNKDVERLLGSVVDIISFREKIGIEETKEILINYLASKNKNVNKLMRYAKILGQEAILRTYLEVLI